LKLKWLRKKEELHINSPTQRAKLATHPEITMEKDTLSIPMQISFSVIMSTDREQAKANICMPMGIAIKVLSSPIKSMESVDSSQKIRDSTMVIYQ
jgi:hypothetical protein